MKEIDRPEPLLWLNSLTNFERNLPKKYVASTFNTYRYEILLERLGNPHRSEIPAVQILGTDGKGSTLALLEALLNRGGKRTKSFISPHLVRVEERFRTDGESIETPSFLLCLASVQAVSAELEGLTYFEVLNAAFWVWVANDPPDFILLETGLGGRLDTTTICNPTLKILTRLERDHFKILGATMDKIASEKLAALRSEAKALIAPQSPYLKVQIVSFLHDRRIPNEWVEHEISPSVVDRSPTGWVHRIAAKDLPELDIRIPLLGDHQSENLSSALLAYRHLVDEWPQTEGPIDLDPKWNGRCQIFQVGGDSWVLDGSHTALGGQALRKMLDQLFGSDRPRTFSFTSTQDRFPWCYLRGLVGSADRIQIVDFHHERLWKAENLKRRLENDGWNDYPTTPQLRVFTPSESFASGCGPEIKVFCGSFYWVGAVLEELRRPRKQPMS